MRLMLTILLSAAACQLCKAEDSRNKLNISKEGETEKRALLEGNEGIKKRAPEAVSPTPLPGIEYANVKDGSGDKAQVQPIFATPVPQIAKISDVLSGQSQVPFSAAIAHHLFSPVSIYQQRLGSPTIYEVSAPVPSQLAYSEHRIYQQEPQLQKFATQNKPNLNRFTLNLNPQQQQQPVIYQQQLQQPNFVSPPQLIQYNQFQQPQAYNHLQAYSQVPQQVYSNTPPQFYQNNLQAPVQYNQNQPPSYLQVFQSIQPGVTFTNKQNAPNGDYLNQQRNFQLNNAREFQAPPLPQTQERPLLPQQNYNVKSQGAVSYASFSQNQPNYAAQNQNLRPIANEKQESATKSPPQQMLYIRPGHLVQNLQYQPNTLQLSPPQSPQQQFYQNPQQQQYNGQILVQNPGYAVPQPVQLSPNYAPVQYFGKFAESIFGNYQH